MRSYLITVCPLFPAPDPGPPPFGWTAREWSTANAMVWQTKTVPARIQEPPLWVSGELARHAGGLQDLPVVVVPSDR